MANIKRGAVGIQDLSVADIGTNSTPPDPNLATVIPGPLYQWNVIVAVIPVFSGPGTHLAGIMFPAETDTEIGDVIEIHMAASAAGGSLIIFDSNGDIISSAGIQSNGAVATIFRKTAASTWRFMSVG